MDNNALIEQADDAYRQSFDGKVWFGRCIFLSWYCEVGTCKFCYRATQKSRIGHAEHARRSIPSVLVEALMARILGWRIEFLTGGYKIYSADELERIIKLTAKVYGDRIWLNLGAIGKDDLDRFRPYLQGIVSSIETMNPELHDKVCPDKKIGPYEDMFSYAGSLEKSMTIVIGLGESRDDFPLLREFIRKHKLSRITFYALKPIKGSPYTRGPATEDYVWWIAKTRTEFPDIEIIAGTTYNRIAQLEEYDTKDEAYLIMKAGANAITKFPATKKFNTEAARKIERQIREAGRELIGTLCDMPDIDWDEEIDRLDIDESLKKDMKSTIRIYIENMVCTDE